jgi:hypothetical protein
LWKRETKKSAGGGSPLAKTYIIQPLDGSYATRGGNYYFKIIVPTASTANYAMNTPVQISPLSMPFDSAEPGEIEWSSLAMTFLRATDISVAWGEFLDPDYKDGIRLEVYRSGSLFWNGVIDYESIQKKDWYYDSGLKYKRLSVTFIDALAYFSKNATTMSDISYSAYDSFGAVIGRMALKLGMNSSAYFLDTDYQIADTYSGTTYDLSDMYLINAGSTLLVSDFIKALWMIGLRSYIWDGKIYINSRKGTTTSQAVSTSDIIKVSADQDNSDVRYIKIDTGAILIATGESISHTVTGGTASGIDDQNLEFSDADFILGEIGTNAGESGVNISSVIYSATTDEILDDTNPFTASNLEYGDVIIYIGTGYDAGITTPTSYVNSGTIEIHDIGLEPIDGENYSIDFGKIIASDGSGYRPKALPLATKGTSEWLAYYAYTDRVNLQLRGLNYAAFHKRFSFNSNSYATDSAKVDLFLNKVEIKLVKVA